MSAIAGFVRFDGAPVDANIGAAMASRLALRGYSLTTATTPHTALIFGTRGSDHLPQPLNDAHAIGLVFDGRLDNRADLIRQLELTPAETDAAIVLSAYRKWGVEFASKLLGDFAVGVVDQGERRVVCARDVFGNRRLHYRSGRGWFAFASSIDCLVAAITPMPEINEGMVGEVLASFVVNVDETVYRDVFRLPAAHVLVATSEGQRRTKYWEPSLARPGYTRDAQYEDHLRALLNDAVRACLRTTAPAAVLLSGGLDSSSVTGVAARLIRNGETPCPRLETFSMVGAGEGDESRYSNEVADRNGLIAHRIAEHPPSRGHVAAEIALDLEPQVFPHSPTVDAVRSRVRERGMRVLLTGVGGDDWLGTAPEAFADLLRQGRLIALVRRFYLDRGADHDPGWRMVLRCAMWPLLPASLQDPLRALLRRGQSPPWIAPAFARKIALADRMAKYRSTRMFDTFEQDANWFESMNGWRMFLTENLTRGADRFALDVAHPFFDRRLVEFCLALPPDQLWRDGRPKDLLRRATRDIVPTTVAARRWSPSSDHVFGEILEQDGGAPPFSDLQVERAGWIDGRVVRAMHDGLRSATPLQRGSTGRILWGICALELWLAARDMVK